MDAHEIGTDHIWLRQTVTFTVDGQSRTLEVGIPVPRDATTQEIEALLGVAEAGMRALSRRLDARIAEALRSGAAPLPPATMAGAESSLPPVSARGPHDTSANGRASVEPKVGVLSAPLGAPDHHASDSRETTPDVADDTVASTDASTPPSTTTTTTTHAPKPAPTPERAAAPRRPVEASRAQTPAAPPTRQPSASASAEGEMTRAQFIAAAAELGLNPRQAMDRLRVRSLEGLNLREALESLRRQLLGASASAGSEPGPESGSEADILPEPEPETQPGAPAPSSAPARYFEEEDEEAILYEMDDEDTLIEEDFAPSSGGNADSAASEDASDVFDLDDVPDLTPPSPPARKRSASAARNPSNTIHEHPAPADDAPPTGSARSHAMQLIGKLRSATGGGPASEYQRNAYRNIVEDELGKAQATALVRGLWRTTSDRLSAAQLDALIRWGKEDVFADEAAQVLGALRAEQRRAAQAETSASGTSESPRTTSRGRSGGGPR